MTVCRRPVASWKPQGVGFSGLDRVGTRKTGVKVPPSTPNECSLCDREPFSERLSRCISCAAVLLDDSLAASQPR
jgi:hypothetical protein